MSNSQSEKPRIEDIRAEIDQVDGLLLDLIAKRLELAGLVRKAKSGVRVWRPSREHSLVRDLASAAGDTPSELVSRIWAELMSASIALQGPMRLHISLEGDALTNWSMVRDRFGAAIPSSSYPTTSAALAAAYAEDEGVAIIPAPSVTQNWWTSLTRDGAMSDMHILSAIGQTSGESWPHAVAVATADILPSGDDVTLIACQNPNAILDAGYAVKLRAESGDYRLLSLDGFWAADGPEISQVNAADPTAKIIGSFAKPLC